MADDRQSRDAQALDQERRQRERELAEALERAEEPEPPVPTSELDALESGLAGLEFPARGRAVRDAVGDRPVSGANGTYAASALVPATDADAFTSAVAVRRRLARPTVAVAMKRIAEAVGPREDAEYSYSQRDAYERTLRSLAAIDADDEDAGVTAITDWIVDRLEETGSLPGSRKVRQEAAAFCRRNGYEIRDDEWLGA